MTIGSGHVPDGGILASLRDSFPPTCVECDYSLVGLPSGSRCPECGAANDASVVTLHGYSPESWATTRPRSLVWATVAVIPFLALLIYDWWRGRSIRPLLIALLMVLGLPAFRALRYLFLRRRTSIPVRLRLSVNGFEQRVGPGPLNLTLWDRNMIQDMRIRKSGRHTLIIRWVMNNFAFNANPILFDFDADRDDAMMLKKQIDDWISHGL